MAEAKDTIETHLRKSLDSPHMSVGVLDCKSKAYYVMHARDRAGRQAAEGVDQRERDSAGRGSGIDGLSKLSNRKVKIWIVRTCPRCGHSDVLPVDWDGVTRSSAAATNYDLLPGDQLYIAEDESTPLSEAISESKIDATPPERIFFGSLGGPMVGRNYNRNRNGF